MYKGMLEGTSATSMDESGGRPWDKRSNAAFSASDMNERGGRSRDRDTEKQRKTDGGRERMGDNWRYGENGERKWRAGKSQNEGSDECVVYACVVQVHPCTCM